MESHLSNDEFFSKLIALFDNRREKDHGSVFLTQKCLTHDPSSSTTAPTTESSSLQPAAPLPILIRASNGASKKDRSSRKVKLSTVVQPDQLEAFFARYAEICKGGMSSLKKRDRSKAKEKLKAKRRKMGVPVGTSGTAEK